MTAPAHLYLHFPFCSGRCRYCAFVSGPPPRDPTTAVDDLLRERDRRAIPLAPLETLYCGGGTPGLLGVDGFKRLTASDLFTRQPDCEWSVELHPATVTEALMATLAEIGVTRISIGVQSFSDATLQRCNRRHTAQQARDAILCAKRYIPDTGIDLIAGLPGVSPNEWNTTLTEALAFDLPHLSVYSLSIDPGSQWHRENMAPPDADDVCDAIEKTTHRLAAAGLERYETSNYARPGFRCRHNLNTWHGGDYLGLGRGAASRIGLTRRQTDGDELTLTPEEDALERALTRLRLADGFNPDDTIARFPLLATYKEHWETTLATLRHHGLLTAQNAPTLRGYEVLDAIIRELY